MLHLLAHHSDQAPLGGGCLFMVLIRVAVVAVGYRSDDAKEVNLLIALCFLLVNVKPVHDIFAST